MENLTKVAYIRAEINSVHRQLNEVGTPSEDEDGASLSMAQRLKLYIDSQKWLRAVRDGADKNSTR